MNPCNIISLNKYSHMIESPVIILKKRNFEVIGEIITYNNWHISLQANGIDEISFDVYECQNGEYCKLWDKIIDLAIIEVQGYGHFEIKINLTDSNEKIKSITGQSLEVELGQLTLNEFHVNDDDATTMEQTDYNEDDFDANGNFIPTVFCSFYDPKHSLLHRVLADKAAHWSIGHVPAYIAINKTDKPELTTQFQRTFTADGTTIYDFLTDDVAKESNVVFLFDTYNRTINCYNLEDYVWEDKAKNEKIIIDAIGDDTTIYIDKDNLAQEISITGDSDSVKNCFRISGGDDIISDRIRAVNMNGTNYIYRFSDFQLAEMPTDLVTKLVQYQLDMNHNEDTYYGENGIFTRLCSAYDKYYLLESKMMPKVEITETTAKDQYLIMIDGLRKMKVGVFLLSSYSSTYFSGITNNIEDLAKILVDARYTVEIVDGSSKYQSQSNTWSGQFHVYRTIDETDTYCTPGTSTEYVNVDDNEVEYARQKVLKALNKTSMLDIDFEVAKMTDQQIKEYFQLYCRSRLQAFYDGYETCISTLAKLTQTTLATDKSVVADELYKRYYNLKNIVYAIFQERTKQVEEQEKIIQVIEKEQSEFQERWNFRSYLGEDLYHIFCMYRRDDEYQNDNYISDGIEDNDAALTKKAKELLDVSKGEIEKSCQLQRSITANLNNLFGMNEFELIHDKFSLFNFIRIGTNDEVFKLRLLGINYDSNTPETIEVIYSENIENINGSSSDINSILNQVSSISSSFSSTVLQAKSGNEANNEIVNMRNNGLNAALTRIKSSDDNEVTIGAQGIICKQITDVGYYSDKQSRIIGSGFYITSDNWKTIRACIGETTDGNFGVIADTLCGKVTFSDKIVAGNESGTVTIDGKGITLDGGAITWKNGNKLSTKDIENLNSILDSIDVSIGKLDGRIQTYSQATKPTWSDENSNHDGDLWLKTGTSTSEYVSGKTYVYVSKTNTWEETTDEKLKALAEKKAQVFTAQPSAPYYLGDIWVQGTGGDILHCTKTRESGSYSASEWNRSSKYTDDTIANYAAEAIYITKSEKRDLYTSWNKIVQEKLSYDNRANTLGMKSNSYYAAYSNAYASLNTLLNTTLKLFVDMDTITALTPTQVGLYKSNFEAYYNSKSALDNEIQSANTGNLNDFKNAVSQALIGDSTIITKDSVISPKIGGGYLYIKDKRSIGNNGISIELNPNGTEIPSSIGQKDGTYVFNIKKDNTLIMGVDMNGNGYFNGAIDARTGFIGNWNISKYSLSSGSRDNIISLDSISKTLYTILGTKKAVLTSGYISFYESEMQMCTMHSTMLSASGERGAGIYCSPDSKFLILGSDNNSSDDIYSADILINNGLNFNGNEHRVQIYSDTYLNNTLTFSSGAFLSALSNYGICCDDNFSTKGMLCVGNLNYGKMLNVNGSAYINGEIIATNTITMNGHPLFYNGLHNTGFDTKVAISDDGLYFRPYLYGDPSAEYSGIVGLGSKSHKWGNIWSTNGVISTSDRNKKKNIRDITKSYEMLFMNLKPKLYEFIDGTSGRTHVGFISQDVEDNLLDKKLNGTDFAGFCKDQSVKTVVDKDGNETEEPLFDENGKPIFEYSLRYEEFIALNTHMIQQCLNENKALNQRVTYLEDNYILKTKGDTI